MSHDYKKKFVNFVTKINLNCENLRGLTSKRDTGHIKI